MSNDVVVSMSQQSEALSMKGGAGTAISNVCIKRHKNDNNTISCINV